MWPGIVMTMLTSQSLQIVSSNNLWMVQDSGKTIVTFALQASGDYQSEAAHPLFLGYPHGPKDAQFVPEGAIKESLVVHFAETADSKVLIKIAASKDSFGCAVGPVSGLGSTFGEPQDSRINAVYDRASDRLIVASTPFAELKRGAGGFAAALQHGAVLTVKKDYFKNHLGYFLWKPKPLWNKPVAGWCSWMAHLQDVTEGDIVGAAEFFRKNLLDYGYNVIQMDDGFQRASQSGEPPLKPDQQMSDQWAIPNAKFPHGLEWLAHQISDRGLTPGIWIGLYLPLGLKHSDGYTMDAKGQPVRGPWVNYAVNGLNKPALNEAYVDTIRKLVAQGWDYFKIDTLRHVLYDNYRLVPDYWKSRHESMEQAYRAVFSAVKAAAGNRYVLACWGTLPELAGLPDGCRIGEDVGPNIASMRRSAKYIAQFNYLNNVVWRNDPDYMCLRVPVEQGQTWVSLVSLAGGHLMVSDPVREYDPARVDLMRRVGPPMMLKPLELASHAPDPEFFTLAARKGDDVWTVVSRFAWKPEMQADVALSDLGLDPSKKYIAFDFWQSKPLGVVQGSAPFKALDEGSCQVVALRPLLSRPQVLGTDRHIGQGVVDLQGVKWNGRTLSGEYRCDPGRQWSLWFHVPSGWNLKGHSPAGATLERQGESIRLRFPAGDGWTAWSLDFTRS